MLLFAAVSYMRSSSFLEVGVWWENVLEAEAESAFGMCKKWGDDFILSLADFE